MSAKGSVSVAVSADWTRCASALSGKDKGLVGSQSSFLSAKDLYFFIKICESRK